jgi:hypothetical protein
LLPIDVAGGPLGSAPAGSNHAAMILALRPCNPGVDHGQPHDGEPAVFGHRAGIKIITAHMERAAAGMGDAL